MKIKNVTIYPYFFVIILVIVLLAVLSFASKSCQTYEKENTLQEGSPLKKGQSVDEATDER
ncbi:MAG: hypothetical protein WCI77_03825 [Candidatus Omnitrophota bacterium]